MRHTVAFIFSFALLGTIIGAVASVLTAEVSVQSAGAGAIIGLVIGASFGLRVAMRQPPPPGAASIGIEERARRDKLKAQVELENPEQSR